MLVKAGLDTSALPTMAGGEMAVATAAHRHLIELLHGHGILVFASQSDATDFLSAVQLLPQGIRKLWTTALPEMLSTRAVPASALPLKDVTGLADLAAHWRGRIEVAFLAASRAFVLGVATTEASKVDPASDVEVSRIELSSESERFRYVVALASSDILRNADRRAVWHERFERLALATKTVTILDRYAVIRLLQGHGQGLEWFLGRLDRSGPVNVHLIAQLSSVHQVQSACAALTALRRQLTSGGVRSLSVTFASNAVFRDEAHSRHVRLGPVAVLIDRGMATFDDVRCGQSTPCRPCDRRAALERERQIEQRSWRRARRYVVW